MKISELIIKLKKIEEVEGDIKIKISDSDWKEGLNITDFKIMTEPYKYLLII